MKIITKEQSKSFATLLIISGIGALWLSFWWYKMAAPDPGMTPRFGDIFIYTVYYHFFNSLLLLLSGILLRMKKIRMYSAISIILAISVLASLFVVDLTNGSGGFDTLDIIENLFVYTIFCGMLYTGGFVGGFLLVPMFLWGVFKSAYNSFRYFRGRIEYEYLETTAKDSKISKKTPKYLYVFIGFFVFVTFFIVYKTIDDYQLQQRETQNFLFESGYQADDEGRVVVSLNEQCRNIEKTVEYLQANADGGNANNLDDKGKEEYRKEYMRNINSRSLCQDLCNEQLVFSETDSGWSVSDDIHKSCELLGITLPK